MKIPPRPTDESRRKSRRQLSLYILAIILLTTFFVRGFTSNIRRVRDETKDVFDFYRIARVHSGDTLDVYNDDHAFLIHLRGITAPPNIAQADAREDFIQESGLTIDQLNSAADGSRRLLEVWGTHQHVLIEFENNTTPSDGGPHEAYVTIGGIDVGRKQLLQGFALPKNTKHPRATQYSIDLTNARKQQNGMWKP